MKTEKYGGQGGIRTHEGLAPLPVFKTGAFNRSATCPLEPLANRIISICHAKTERQLIFLRIKAGSPRNFTAERGE